MTVRRGERVSFSTSGEVQLSADANDKATPAGASSGTSSGEPDAADARRRRSSAAIGAVQMFGIGNQTGPLGCPRMAGCSSVSTTTTWPTTRASSRFKSLDVERVPTAITRGDRAASDANSTPRPLAAGRSHVQGSPDTAKQMRYNR